MVNAGHWRDGGVVCDAEEYKGARNIEHKTMQEEGQPNGYAKDD
jgi:hypothetical protein